MISIEAINAAMQSRSNIKSQEVLNHAYDCGFLNEEHKWTIEGLQKIMKIKDIDPGKQKKVCKRANLLDLYFSSLTKL